MLRTSIMWRILEKQQFMWGWHSIKTYSLELLAIKYRPKNVCSVFFTPKHDLLYCTEPENRSVSPENSHWLLSQSPFRCLVIDFLCRDTSARHLSLGCCVKSSLISGYRRRSDDFHVHNITSKSVWIIAVWDKGITRIIMWLRIWIWI